MSSWKQRKNTTKLPKALREELVSLGTLTLEEIFPNVLGKLDPHRAHKTSGAGRKGDKKAGGFGNKPNVTGNGTGRSNPKPAYRPPPKSTTARRLPAAEESSGSEEELLDEEDIRIAELEKRLGLDKKNPKLGDDDLDGWTLNAVD
jgi:hypothetical protein